MELESALLIIPPRKVQAFAYPLREEFDAESFNRVPAHITLLYPFVPSDQVAEIIPTLEALCAGIPAFEIELDRYGRFEDAIFLESSKPDKLQDLYQQLINTFPDYPAYKGEHGTDLHPHLTLARFEDPAEGDKIELPPEPRFTFTVKQLHLYLGAVDDVEAPFIPRAVIPLGNPA
jgi:2'-5' RNA ligase